MTMAISHPALGSADSAMLYLSNSTFTGAGTIHITATDSYNGPISGGEAGFMFDVGGYTAGTASFSALLGSSLLGSLGPFSGGAFSGSTGGWGSVAATAPFSFMNTS